MYANTHEYKAPPLSHKYLLCLPLYQLLNEGMTNRPYMYINNSTVILHTSFCLMRATAWISSRASYHQPTPHFTCCSGSNGTFLTHHVQPQPILQRKLPFLLQLLLQFSVLHLRTPHTQSCLYTVSGSPLSSQISQNGYKFCILRSFISTLGVILPRSDVPLPRYGQKCFGYNFFRCVANFVYSLIYKCVHL